MLVQIRETHWPSLADLGRSRPDVGRNLAQTRPKFVNVGRIWANFRPNVASSWLKLTKFGHGCADVHQSRTHLDEVRTEFDQTCAAKFGRTRAKVDRNRGRNRPKLADGWPDLPGNGWSKIDRCRFKPQRLPPLPTSPPPMGPGAIPPIGAGDRRHGPGRRVSSAPSPCRPRIGHGSMQARPAIGPPHRPRGTAELRADGRRGFPSDAGLPREPLLFRVLRRSLLVAPC